MQEDPHRRGEFDHADNGLAMVCMDFKEFVKGRPVHIVLRGRSTGTTFGVKCRKKGQAAEWIIKRIVSTLDDLGLDEL